MTDRGFLGVLMLDTRFPRPPGDIGNPVTFERAGIPVRYTVVSEATPLRVVRQADDRLLGAFIESARKMQALGACAITTTCGFLARHQAALQSSVDVPVMTSSLLLCRGLDAPLESERGGRVGIVTIDAASLTSEVLEGANVPPETPVQGVAEDCEFRQRILGNDVALDVLQAGRDVTQAARDLMERAPGLRHIVLECANMPPYRDLVARATGCEVHDIETGLLTAWRGWRERST